MGRLYKYFGSRITLKQVAKILHVSTEKAKEIIIGSGLEFAQNIKSKHDTNNWYIFTFKFFDWYLCGNYDDEAIELIILDFEGNLI